MSQKILIKKELQAAVAGLIGARATDCVINHLEIDNRISLDDYSPQNIERIKNAIQLLLGEGIAVAIMSRVFRELDKMMSEHVPTMGMRNFNNSVNPEDNEKNHVIPKVASTQKFPQAVESTLDLLGASSKRALLAELEQTYNINIYNGSPSVLLPELEKALSEIFSPAVAVLLLKDISAKIK